MSGTKLGGLRAKQANIERYGKDYYSRIGTKGGEVTGVLKGFAIVKRCDNKRCELHKTLGEHKIAQCAGTKGGANGRRKTKKRKV